MCVCSSPRNSVGLALPTCQCQRANQFRNFRYRFVLPHLFLGVVTGEEIAVRGEVVREQPAQPLDVIAASRGAVPRHTEPTH